MKVSPIRTEKIRPYTIGLFQILDKYVKKMPEGSVLALTSVMVSICEGRVIKIGEVDKDDLIKGEADLYLPRKISRYNLMFTITRGILIPSAGIDESNTGGYYALFPKDPQKTANAVRRYLASRFKLKKVGVIITDSKTSPLRWGTNGVALTHSGFSGLNSYIGKPDIFGRNLKMTKANIMDALAASAVVTMGEGDEQTPLAIIEDVPFIKFQGRDPSAREIRELAISIEDDLYSPLLKAVKWRKGKKK